MPKVVRSRIKQHSASVATSLLESRKKAQKEVFGEDDDADLMGLDVESAANESEASKRAALADALKDLIAMDDDDDESDGEGDASMSDVKMPARGTLFKAAKPAAAAAAPAAPVVSKTPAASPLVFAPSAPSRSAVSFAVAPEVAPAVGEDGEAAPFRKPSKIDKRAARHSKLMNRLGLPGTDFGGRGQKKHAAPGAFHALRQDLTTALLSPTEQNARTMAARRAAAASEKRDVLFLSDGADQVRMQKLQESIAESKVIHQKVAAANAAAAAAQPQSMARPVAAAAATPSPFVSNKPLSAAAKRKLHARELAQFSAVLHHPQFQAAPLQSLQLHLENSAQMQRLQAEASSMLDGTRPAAQGQPKKQMTGSQKKKKKAVDDRRQQILSQMKQ